ncbi:MAG: glycosyltransferase [Phycisphaerales bacterium]|nr:glycosyltransferase [Phycisphaerales bacterium]
MRIGAVGSYWTGAAEHAGLEFVALPQPIDAMPRPQADPVASRLRDGNLHQAAHVRSPVSLIVDSNFEGLGFLPALGNPQGVDLLHERIGVPLASHLVDPLLTCMRGLPANVALAAARSRTWWKFAFDRALAAELRAFGVPSVEYLPQAAPDRIAEMEFVRAPLDVSRMERQIAFIGSQATNYFGANAAHKGDHQLVGAMALARKLERPESTFFEAYHEAYGFADAPSPNDSAETLASKFAQYQNHKLFYVAALWVAQRNRYVRALTNKLGSDFHLHGSNWESLGVRGGPAFEGEEGYLRAFRTSLININLNNGNTETGLNQRAFEITAAGGFMLCAAAPELPELFRVGEECDCFRNETELFEKIAYYRAHPERTAEIAFAGQQRTLKEHLFSNRIRTMVERTGATSIRAAA